MALAQKYRDLAARAGWSAAGAFVATFGAPAVVEMIDADVKARIPGAIAAAIPSVAALFSAIKSFIGTKVGDPDTVTISGPEDRAVREATRTVTEIPVATDDLGVPVVAVHDGQVMTNPFAVQPIPLAPPPFRDGVEVDSGEADPVDPPEWAT